MTQCGGSQRLEDGNIGRDNVPENIPENVHATNSIGGGKDHSSKGALVLLASTLAFQNIALTACSIRLVALVIGCRVGNRLSLGNKVVA
jgi:hypothetical protein